MSSLPGLKLRTTLVKMVEVDIVLKRPDTLTLTIVEFIKVVIKVVAMVEVERGLKIPDIIPLKIVYQEFMLTVEVDIGLRQSTLPTITKVAILNFQVCNFFLVLLTKMFKKMIECNILVMSMIGVI